MRRMTMIGLLAVFAIGAAHATPWFTQDPRTLPEGKWRVEEHVFYSETGDALVDGDRQALPGGADATSLTLHTRVRYGVNDDLTVFADIPWVLKEFTAPDGTKRDADGFGDLMFLGKYKYHDDRDAGTRRAFALFIKPDTGDTDVDVPLLRTGTGTTNFGAMHLWEKQAGATTWYASLGYIYTGDSMDLDPGDVFAGNIAAEHEIGDGWKGVWEVNARHQGQAELGGQDVPDSEWTVISLSPGVQYWTQPEPGQQAVFEAGVQIPTFEWGDRGALEDYTIYGGGFWIF
ncbi:MAG: transporter [Armatimonadota bacterium]